MISKHIDTAAKTARLMYDAGRSGMPPKDAAHLAVENLPQGVPMRSVMVKALRHYFKE